MTPTNNLSKRIWILIVSVLVLLVVVSTSIDGFKLKDLSAHDQPDGNKSPRKVPFGGGGSKTPQFRKIAKVVKIEDDDEDEEEAIDENGDEEKDVDDEDEEEESKLKIKFEKVRKADVVDKAEPIFKMIAKEEEKEQDAVAEEAGETLSYSMLSFLKMFGIGAGEGEQESNALINWLRSFKQGDSKAEEAIVKPEEPEDSIYEVVMGYLDRWPFNLVLEFDKKDEIKAETSASRNSTTKRAKQPEAPISREQFAYLLNRLPSFVIDPELVEESECRKQLQIFARQLRGQKLWTLQMLDSTGKISSGVLRGNINQFGDFDQCVYIRTSVKLGDNQSMRMKGKYCLAHIDVEVVNNNLKLPIHMALGRNLLKSQRQNPFHFVPRYTTVNWGVCLPHSCSAKMVKNLLENNLKMFNATGVHFHVDVNEKDCFVRRSYDLLQLVTTNWKLGLTIAFYGSFLVMIVLGTVTEYWTPVKSFIQRNLKNLLKTSKPTLEKESSADEQSDDQGYNNSTLEATSEYSISRLFKELLLSFSLKRTLGRLVGRPAKEEIAGLNGLKVLATFSIYLFLKFLMMGHLPITNRDHLVKTMSYPLSILLRTPLIYLDTFLFVSGTVSAYRMCQEQEDKSGISIMRRIVGRLIRSLPTLFAVLYFQTWVMPHIGSGPLWSNLVSHNTKLCEQNMWRNFFTVQNAMNLEETCSPFTIQLAVDQQLYLLAPLIVWLYYNNPDIGLILYGIIHTLSVASRFSKTITERLSPIVFHGMNVTQFYRTANYVYSSPIQRATAFISGIGIGILLKSTDRPFRLPRLASLMGWMTAIWCLVWCFWYPSNSTSVDFIYEPSFMAPYSSWAPLLLSFTLGWITFTTFTSNAPSTVSSLLSSDLIQFLSKIAYPMQMVSYVVIVYTIGVAKDQTTFSISDLVNFQEILVIVGLSTILAIIFDLPMQNIRKILIEFELPDKKPELQAIKDNTSKRQLPWVEDNTEVIPEEEEEDTTSTENQTNSSNRNEEDMPGRVKLNRFEKANGNTEFEWKRYNELPDESWRTESDMDQLDSATESQSRDSDEPQPNAEVSDEEADEEVAEQDEEDEEDEELSESDEVIRRPVIIESSFRRRAADRWNVDED